MYIHILFLILGSICLITTFVMSIWFSSNRVLNVYLLFTFSFASLYLIFHGLSNLDLFQNIYYPNFNYYQIILILMPTLYLYFEKLFKNLKIGEKNDFQHFILPVVLLNFLFSIENILLFSLMLSYSTYYIYKTFLLLKNNYWGIKKNHPFTYDFSMISSWTKFLFVIEILYLIIIYSLKIESIIKGKERCNFYYEIALLILYSTIYFKIIFSPFIFYGNPSLFKRIESSSVSKLCITSVWEVKIDIDAMNPKERMLNERIMNNISDYIEQIEKIVLIDFALRNPDYSLYNLSLEIGIPKYYLDFIFKFYCKVSFNDYKKMVRIYDAVELINSGYLKSNKLVTLSKHVGFSSYNPFLVNFKNLTGVSPFEFYRNRKIIKKC